MFPDGVATALHRSPGVQPGRRGGCTRYGTRLPATISNKNFAYLLSVGMLAVQSKPNQKGNTMPAIIGIEAMLSGCEPDEIVAGVRGTVKKVLKTTNFGKGDKAGTVQKVIVRDDAKESVDIAAKLWNHESLDADDVGRKIVFLAHQGQKGMTGLRLKEDTYDGKTSLILDVGDRAEVTFHDGIAKAKAAPANTDDDTKPPTDDDDNLPFGDKPAAKAPPAAPAARPKVPAGDGGFTWKAVGASFDRLGALYSAAFAQAQNKCAAEIEKRTGVKIPEDQIREVATTLFIEYNRKGYPLPDEPFAHYAEMPSAES